MRLMKVGCLAIILILSGLRQASASEGFEDLVKVVKSGVAEKTLLDYVNSSPVAYALTVDEVLYLSDLGLSAETIQAINAHGQKVGVAAPVPETPAAEAPAANVASVLEQAGAGSEPAATEAVAEAPAPPPPAAVVQETVTAPPVVTAPPANAVDYSTFYDGLAPYGNWIETDGQWCWQPTAVVVDSAWSPYCQRGRWVYSDCGWAWESSYSWGWAPFHYGRWRHHPRWGWIWRPDRVWGPAWVCWRYSDEAIGWAPLPPEAIWDADAGLCFGGRPVLAEFDFGLTWGLYTFVPVERFCELRVGQNRFSRSRAEGIFRAASVVQNRVAFQDGHIRNFGPPPAHITARTHQEIRPVRIVDEHVRAGDPIRRPRLSGSTLAFYRPPVAATARENPRQVVVRREADERSRRAASPHDDAFRISRSAPTVQGEQTRGRESRAVPRTAVAPAVSAPPDVRRRDQQRLTEEAARQRQAEEAVARQQGEQRRRADDLIRAQNAERQHAQEQAQQRALAEQQHRQADYARQQETQRRAEEVARQQEQQRQVQEASRRQEQQRQAEAAARAAAEQRQAVRAQRVAEETAARQQEAEVRAQRAAAAAVAPQHAARQPPPEVPQGYGESSATAADSSRGASSRHTHGR